MCIEQRAADHACCYPLAPRAIKDAAEHLAPGVYYINSRNQVQRQRPREALILQRAMSVVFVANPLRVVEPVMHFDSRTCELWRTHINVVMRGFIDVFAVVHTPVLDSDAVSRAPIALDKLVQQLNDESSHPVKHSLIVDVYDEQHLWRTSNAHVFGRTLITAINSGDENTLRIIAPRFASIEPPPTPCQPPHA